MKKIFNFTMCLLALSCTNQISSQYYEEHGVTVQPSAPKIQKIPSITRETAGSATRKRSEAIVHEMSEQDCLKKCKCKKGK